FADLELDPAEHGCQSFEATDFLLYRRRFDPRSLLVLWQVGLVGDLTFRLQYTPEPLKLLVEVLGEHYSAEHEVVLYRASELPMAEACIERLPLGRLGHGPPDVMSTLCVPPLSTAVPDPVMLERLGLADAESADG
ncbi:MAG: hypothetical protein MI919_40090, partial [Holophagales bacterium]|nr:hypothetical protein [Holophagales bacterium]